MALFVGCSNPTTLEPPPEPNPIPRYTEDGDPCEFDSWCRPTSLCWDGECTPRSDLYRADTSVPPCETTVLVSLDISGSMRPYLSPVKSAVQQWVETLPPEVRVGLQVFPSPERSSFVVLQPTDPASFLALLQDVRLGGGSEEAAYDIIHDLATDRTEVTWGTGRQVVLMFTDEGGATYRGYTEREACTPTLFSPIEFFIWDRNSHHSHFDTCGQPVTLTSDVPSLIRGLEAVGVCD